MIHPVHAQEQLQALENLDHHSNIEAKIPYTGNLWWRPFKDPIWVIGLCLVLISGGVLALGSAAQNGIFPFNYFFVLAYSFVLWGDKRLKWWFFGTKPEHYDTYFLYAVLWLCSCFALNREIGIFNESTPWLSWHLVLSSVVCIGYAWKDAFSPRLRAFWLAAMAWTLVLMTYFALYLLPMMMVSTLVFWFFGLSLHTFIPLVFAVHIFRVLAFAWESEVSDAPSGYTSQHFAVITGFCIPVAMLIGFLVSWDTRLGDIQSGINQSDAQKEQQLPRWVNISQHIRRDWMTERVLKSSIYYQSPSRKVEFFPDTDNSDLTHHDPLVLIAQMLLPFKYQLDDTERANLLRTLFDGRHELQERLWTGRDLFTSSVATNARLEPALRLAYTEKTLTIRNTARSSWLSQQEAIYTFQLPEGAAISSLSLWINGREEKARLGARSKADSAYSTIVGRERRDPSVVHWQEGNTVTLRVFPCTSQEERQVKIGITSPLREEDGALVFDNIAFQGPPATGATEDIHLDIADDAAIFDKPFYVKENADGTYAGHDKYRQDWKIRLEPVPFKENSFSFNGKTYHAEPYKLAQTPFRPDAIYLDLNAAWSLSETRELLAAAKNTPIQVPTPTGFVTLSADNLRAVYDQCEQLRFCLFPFHCLANAAQALVVSKGSGAAPILKDLRNSSFGKNMAQQLSVMPQVRVFHLGGDEPTPYLRSLAECRAIQLHGGSLHQLTNMLAAGLFYQNPETAQSVVIPGAGVRISRMPGESQGKGPDHLLRLFAYNDVLRRLGTQYLNNRYEPEALVEAADEAFIVTPVTSLIVLESAADYDRFDLKKSKNSLQDASFAGAGSVPEPSEWALLGLLLVAVFFGANRARFGSGGI